MPRRPRVPLREVEPVVPLPDSSPLAHWPEPLVIEPLDMLSVHSPSWSLRLLSWSVIWARRDHRNSPAAAAPAATAAVASGRSRAISATPQSLLLLPRLLFLAIISSPLLGFTLSVTKRLKALAVSPERRGEAA